MSADAETGAGSFPPSAAAVTSALSDINDPPAALSLTVTWKLIIHGVPTATESEPTVKVVPVELFVWLEPHPEKPIVLTEPTDPVTGSPRPMPLALLVPVFVIVTEYAIF